MSPIAFFTLMSVLLFLGMIVCLEVGRFIGRRKMQTDPAGAKAGVGTVEGAIFALLGLLIAFTFSGAATRFQERRQLVVEEANAIGTAYLRIDLVDSGRQPALRELFRSYVDARLEVYRRTEPSTREDLSACSELQTRIWQQAVAACEAESSPAPATLFLSALNEMFDITTTRAAAARMHPPEIIFAMLCILSLGSALLAGYGMAEAKRPSWLHILAFSAITAGTVYVICDIEFPRLGLVRVDKIDQLLIDVRAGMK